MSAMKFRFVLVCFACVMLCAQMAFADGTDPHTGNSGDGAGAGKSASEPAKVAEKKASGKSDPKKIEQGKYSKSTKKAGSKNSSSRKKNKKSKKGKGSEDKASLQVAFSAEEIERYRAMPFETWESPRETSTIGLPIEPGFAQPYPYENLLRQYDGNNCRHRGLDIGTVGEKNGGMGTVVNAVVKSKITLIGKTGGDIGEFGRLDKRTGEGIRTGRKYPRQILVPGYGLVYPLSLDYGRWRSGTVVVTKVLEGPLKDYTIRYMHLATVRPDLKVGDIVEAGEHLALMGSTAVMDSPPHVHIDMETPTGARDDLAPYIGLKETKSHCRSSKNSKKSSKSTKKSSKNAKKSTRSSKSSGASKTVSSTGITKRSRASYVQSSKPTVAPETRELQR